MLMGIVLFILGLLLSVWPTIFGWFGKLPGDIRIVEPGRYGFYFPITSMIIVSLALTLLFNLFFKK